MKKYITFVKDEEESRKVQEALFKAGFKWYGGSKHVTCAYVPFLFIDDGAVTHSGNLTTVGSRVHEGCKCINSEDIISDPFQLDGATQPEKMIMIGGKEISESTIKAALQEYVK